jgi:hypothetical protein
MGHSGSTLLDLILGSHPEVFGLGELATLNKFWPKICGICEGECKYWHGRASLTVLRRHFLHGSKTRLAIRELSRYYRSIYSYLSEWFGYSIFIDSSKRPEWVGKQLRYRRHWKTMTPYLIHLTRDGRGVVNSYLRKYPERGIETITEQWIQTTHNTIMLYDQFKGPKCRIAYEKLATRSDELIRKVCNFIGIDYNHEMLSYWNYEHHNINGNAGTLSLISRKSSKGLDRPAVKAGTWHRGYYQKIDKNIILDLRWKAELSREQIEHFEKYAGKLNYPYRYDD